MLTHGELTIFVASSSEMSQAARHIMASWVREGLIAESYWTDPTLIEDDSISVHQECAPSIPVELAGADENIGLPLAAVVASRRFSTIRLIAVHLVPKLVEADEAVVGSAHTAYSFLRNILPVSTRVVTVNLVVPASGVSGVPRSLLIPGWDANVLAAAEDRPAPLQASVLVTESNFAGHAALHAAVAGGLFSVQSDAPYDEPRESVGHLDVTIARCFARSVVVEPFFEKLETRTFDYEDEWPIPAAANLRASVDPLRLTRSMAVAARELDGGALMFRPYQRPPAPQPRTIGLLAALGMFFRNIRNRTRDIPSEVLGRVQGAIEARATSLVRGVVGLREGSALLPTVGGRQPLSHGGEFALLVRDANSVLEQLNARQTVTLPANPLIWEAIRTASFALVDGSDIPDPFPKLMLAGFREVISDPSFIAADPLAGAFQFSSGVSSRLQDLNLDDVDVRPMDAAKTNHVVDRLVTELVLATTPVAVEDEGDESSAESEAASIRAGAIEEALDEIRSWERSRNCSFLWMVTDQVGREVNKARDTFNEAWARVQDFLQPNFEADEAAARKAFRLREFVVLVGFVAAVVLTIAMPKVFLRSWIIGSLWCAIVGSASVLAVSFAYLAYCRRMFALEHRLQMSTSEYDVAAEAASQALAEVARLSSIYETLLDWGEIIGWCVHHPWGTENRHAVEPPDAQIDGLITPHALIVATATADDAMLRRTANLYASQRLYQVGWLNSVYANRSGEALVVAAREGDVDFDELVADREGSRLARARDAVRQSFADNGFSERYRHSLTEDLALFCSERGPNEVVNRVTANAGPLGVVQSSMSLADFLSDAADSDGFLARHGLFSGVESTKVDQTVCWLPMGLPIKVPQNCYQRPYMVDAGFNDRYVVAIVVLEKVRQADVDSLIVFGPAVRQDDDDYVMKNVSSPIVG